MPSFSGPSSPTGQLSKVSFNDDETADYRTIKTEAEYCPLENSVSTYHITHGAIKPEDNKMLKATYC